MKKRIMIVLLVAALVVPLGACRKKPNSGNKAISSAEFDAMMLDWFKEDISSDYTDLHFGLEHPEKFGITCVEVTLGSAISDDEETAASLNKRISALEELSTENLTDDQKITYDTLLTYYRNALDWTKVENDYSFAFTPNSGVNNNLTTAFMEFVLRSEQDARDLIELVKDSRRYVKECIDYTRDQFDKGIVQTDGVIDMVVEQCERFISKREDNEVIRVFNENLEELNLGNESEYKAQMRDAVLNYLIPAYEDIIAMYDEIKGSGKAKGALANYGAEGKRFYELIFRDKSSSSKSVSDWEKTLKKTIKNLVNDEISFARKNYSTYLEWIDGSYSYGMDEAYEIFTALKQKMVSDFPAYPEVDYTVSYLDPSVTSENISAYYLVAPYDNMNTNVVKANPAYALSNANDYVVTLSHEGYPGHLYQNTYYFTSHPENAIRYNLSFLGYSEGWAMYVEDYAMDYFAPDSKLAYLDKIDNKITYYLEAYLDILINYEGYSVSQLGSELDDMGFNGGAASQIYDTLLGDPGIFVPYSVGMYQMNELRQHAQDKLGTRFDPVEYHKVILDTGDTVFDILEKEVEKYIKAAK